MKSVLDLYREVRKRFPEATQKADAEHQRLGFSIEPEYSHLWFEHLANALNQEMEEGVPFGVHESLFFFFAEAHSVGSAEVKECIDVSFVENLFWQVDMVRHRDYWHGLPQTLKELYVGFHGTEP